MAIVKARMPVAKFVESLTGVACDVCINNHLAVANTRLLLHYSEVDGRLRDLVYIIKHWAKRRGVNEPFTGTLSSYCYVLMCIHLLQTRRPPILPCLQVGSSALARRASKFANIKALQSFPLALLHPQAMPHTVGRIIDGNFVNINNPRFSAF